MRGVNKVTIIGTIGQDLEMKTTESGKNVVSFSMATNESYNDSQGQKVEKTEWHNIVAWGKPAEILCEYVGKGSSLYVEGKLQTRNYEKDGVKHYRTEILLQTFQFLNSKAPDDSVQQHPDDSPAAAKSTKKPTKQDEEISVEDIPF